MRLHSRLTSCLHLLVWLVAGANITHATPSFTASPSTAPPGHPITMVFGNCGPKSYQVNFYASTSNGTVYSGTPIGTAWTNAGRASYTWNPPGEGTYYIGAAAVLPQYCSPSQAQSLIEHIIFPYYGFFGSSSPQLPDVTSTITNFANTAWIDCSGVSDCASRLQEAQAYNMHAVVDFPSPGLPPPGSPSATVTTWKTSWQSNWQSYVNTFTSYVNNGTIVAFYPYDEPFGGEWAAGNNASDTTSYLNFVAQTIKQTFPTERVAMVFTGANTFTYLQHGQNVIPASYDWIGIDIYECWSVCNDSNNVLSEPYTWYVQTLESNLYPGQRVILLPATAIYYGGTIAQFRALPSSNWTGYVTIVGNILNLATTDNHVIGVFGFLYQDFYQGGGVNNPGVWVGPSDSSMPAMLNLVTSFGTNDELR